MKRITAIVKNEKYISALEIIKSYEKNRIYCRHDEEHFFSVARIGYILILENGLDISRELFYAAALLHDMGRAAEYTDGKPHDEASAEFAEEVLRECSFDEEEIRKIKDAVLMHRCGRNTSEPDLSDILFKADKLSRACYNCAAEKSCKWEKNRKNSEIEY